jgi:uncharacterized protein YlaI
MRLKRHPLPPKPVKTEERPDLRGLETSLFEGYSDINDVPIYNDDWYGNLLSLGFWNADGWTKSGPMTHDVNTTTVLHYYDTAKQKTPLDNRLETTPNLAEIAKDFKQNELHDIQDWSNEAARAIQFKTHRIQNDPIRKFQAQVLIDIQTMKSRLKNPHNRIHPVDKMVTYNAMLLNVNTLLLERITDVLDYQEKIYMFNKYEDKPRGVQFYAELTLTDGNNATKFDFIDATKNKNVPNNSNLYDYPYHKLFWLQVVMDSGTNIFLATNKPDNNLETTVKISSTATPYTMEPKSFAIESLNIRAQGADATVRLFGLF